MIQMPLPGFLPKSGWKQKPLPVFHPGQPVSIDVETCDPGLGTRGPGGWRKEGHLVGVAAACGKETIYAPIGTSGLREWIATTAKVASAVVFANALYDLEWLESALGLDLSALPIHDVQIAEPLIDEDRLSYSLDALAKHYLGETKDERLLSEALAIHGLKGKEDLWKLPAEFVGPYAEADVRLTLAVWQEQMLYLERENLLPIYALERAVIPVLHRMRRKGVRVDMDAVSALRQELIDTEFKLQEYLGHVNVNAGADLKQLCDRIGAQYDFTDKGNPSFTKDWLRRMAPYHPEIQAVADLRQAEKIRSSFLDSAIGQSVDRHGILRCTWHQMRDPEGGTLTGRMSASKPNIQQIPRRGRLGQKVRECFIPPNGGKWLKLDYSQQEPRLMVHFACATNMPGARDVAQMYRDGGDIYHCIMDVMGWMGGTEQERKERRDQSKTITLGMMYGMGDESLGNSLKLSKQEAADLRKKLYARIPFLGMISEDVKNVAIKRGYIRTILGRHQRFDDWEPNYSEGAQPVKTLARAKLLWPDKGLRRAWTHTALNKLIQGSAADMTKKLMTMTKADLMIAVHDEVGAEVHDEKDVQEIQQVAETCVPLLVPVKADVKLGRSWGG